MHQTQPIGREYSMLLSTTHTVYEVRHDIGRRVKSGSCFFVEPEVKTEKSMDRINGISCYLK